MRFSRIMSSQATDSKFFNIIIIIIMDLYNGTGCSDELLRVRMRLPDLILWNNH